MTALFQFVPPTLPTDPCIRSWQDLINYLADAQIIFNSNIGNSFFNYGSSVPTAENRVFPWMRTDSDELDGWYYWSSGAGAWVKPHPVPASSESRQLWVGSVANLVTYDGGDSGAIGDYSGAMWEVDTNFAARFLIGPGTLPSSTVLAVGDTGGEEEHSLTEAEMPPHVHAVDSSKAWHAGRDCPVLQPVGSDIADPDYASNQTGSTGGSGSPVAVEAHNNMPPYKAIYVIKRTARKYYVA